MFLIPKINNYWQMRLHLLLCLNLHKPLILSSKKRNNFPKSITIIKSLHQRTNVVTTARQILTQNAIRCSCHPLFSKILNATSRLRSKQKIMHLTTNSLHIIKIAKPILNLDNLGSLKTNKNKIDVVLASLIFSANKTQSVAHHRNPRLSNYLNYTSDSNQF